MPTMQLAIYAVPDTAFYTTAGGFANSDVFFSSSYVDTSQGVQLGTFDGFTDLDDRNISPNYYNNFYGKSEVRIVDITSSLQQYLNNNNTNICRLVVAPATYPADINISVT